MSGREMARMNHEDRVWTITFSPDGQLLATGSRDHTAQYGQYPKAGR
jgi:WD40 repeat protein